MMRVFKLAVVFCFIFLVTPARQTLAQTTDLQTDFTYQGFLSNAGDAVNASCNFQFSLFDAALNGNQIGTTQQLSNVVVSNGAFSVPLDFGAGSFNGQDRYLQIAVQCPGDAAFTLFSPREAILPAPYAGYALSVPWSGITGVPTGFADGVDDISTGWSLTGNAGTTPGTNFIGTTDNVALEFFVNNLRALRIEPVDDGMENESGNNVIGGYGGNTVTAGVVGATVFGGGQSSDGSSTYPNSVTGNFGTVSGGANNAVSAHLATVAGGALNTSTSLYATVSGGSNNTASGNDATVSGGGFNTASGSRSTIGGGGSNTASGNTATVGGGGSNTASGIYATVAGGSGNTASGDYATVAGGSANTAAGNYSFVAGARAKNSDVAHGGVFLFADGAPTDFNSAAANEFAARAGGGVRFVVDSTTCGIPDGGVSWSCTSSREAKHSFESVDPRSVLETLADVPITTWAMNGSETVHMGPVAEDFYAAFGLGADDKSISTVDADGVALAAIQGLYDIVQEKDAQIRRVEARLNDLEQQNHYLVYAFMLVLGSMIAAGLYFRQRSNKMTV